MKTMCRYALFAALATAVLVAVAAADHSVFLVGGILPILLGLMLLADGWHRESARDEAVVAQQGMATTPARSFRRHMAVHTRRKPANAPKFRSHPAGEAQDKPARR